MLWGRREESGWLSGVLLKHSKPAVHYILNVVGGGGRLVVVAQWQSTSGSSQVSWVWFQVNAFSRSSCSPHNINENPTCLHSSVSCLDAHLKDMSLSNVLCIVFQGVGFRYTSNPLSKFGSTFPNCCVASPIVLLCLANGWDTAGSIEVYVLESLLNGRTHVFYCFWLGNNL